MVENNRPVEVTSGCFSPAPGTTLKTASRLNPTTSPTHMAITRLEVLPDMLAISKGHQMEAGLTQLDAQKIQ
jgi:hypothetical protein